MANDNNSSADNSSVNNANSEMYIHYSDSSIHMLATQILNGENFAQWQRSAVITLLARNKLGFVKGTCAQPSSNSPDLLKWKRCYSIVMSWILHSVEPSIASSILCCKTSADIWKELQEMFGHSNARKVWTFECT